MDVENRKFHTVREFLEEVGRARFQNETGLRASSVQRAIDENVFPDRWVWEIRRFCQEVALDLPENLFRCHPDAKPLATIGGLAQ